MIYYSDFILEFERKDEQYQVTVSHSLIGEAVHTFSMPFNKDRLELLVVRLGQTRKYIKDNRRTLFSTGMQAAKELGGGLFKAVFAGEVLRSFQKSLELAGGLPDSGLRLKLCLQKTPELGNIPWEFLLDAELDRFFSHSIRTPVVRYLDIPEKISPFQLELPLQILAVVSSPTDYIRLKVDEEVENLKKALAPLIDDKKVNVTVLTKATPAALQQCLRKNKYHVFHFIGHGGFETQTEEGVLLFQNEQGKGLEMTAARISAFLHDHPSFRLAILNSCEGARNSADDAFAGVASNLVRHGMPAVVAMQFQITDEAAITFSREFYTAVADGFPIDAATAEGRKAIFASPNDIEWGTPVLYMRSANGILFDIEKKVSENAHSETLPVPDTRTQVRHPIESPHSSAEWNYPGLNALAVNRDGSRIGLGSRHGNLHIKSMPDESQTLIQTVNGEVRSIAFSADGSIAAGTKTGDLVLSKTTEKPSFHPKLLQRERSGPVNKIVFSPDGATLLSVSGNGDTDLLQCWDIRNEQLRFSMSEQPGVQDICFSPDGQLFSCVYHKGGINIRRAGDGSLLKSMELSHGNVNIDKACFSPDGTLLACLTKGKARIWAAPDFALIDEVEILNGISLAFSGDGEKLAIGCGFPIFEIASSKSKASGNVVHIWDFRKTKLIAVKDCYPYPVSMLAWSASGILVAGSREGFIRMINRP